MSRLIGFTYLLAVSFASGAFGQTNVSASDVKQILRTSLDPVRFPASPGCVASVQLNGESMTAAAGLASVEFAAPLDPTTPMYVGSVGKQFIATIALTLEARGELDLGAPAGVLVPELSAGLAGVTGRHLLTHTSGVRDYLQADHHAGAGLHEPADVEGILQLLSRQGQPDFTPGNEVSYSNSNYFILARLIERATDRSLADVARELVFEPLGMRATRFLTDGFEVIPGRARAYSGSAEDGYHLHEPVVGSEGLLTTLEDLQRWALHLRSLRRSGDPLFTQLTTPARLPNGHLTQEAAGLRVAERLGRPVVEHSGSNRGFKAYFGWYPDDDAFVVVLCNVRQASATGLAEDIAARIFDAERPARSAYPTLGTEALDILAPRAGVYQAEDSDGVLELEVDAPYALATLYGDDPSESRTATRVLGQVGDPTSFSLSGLEGASLSIGTDPAVAAILVKLPFRSIRYERADRPDPADLRSLAGRYRSEYLKVSYVLSTGEGGDGEIALSIERPDGRRVKRGALVPVTRDFYVLQDDPVTNLRVIRNEHGHASGFRLTEPRMRAVVFERSHEG